MGRVDDEARLLHLVETVLDGTSQTLLLSGEAGIGKSRLIDEARARLADRVQVVLGRCLDCGGQPAPYVAVMDALHGLVADLGVERVARAAGPGRAELARLEPMLGPAAKDFDLGRTRLMEAVVELVEGLSARRPMMLVIEDVHWADPSTLDLIGFCAATVQGPVLLVLTYRGEELCAGDRLSVWLSETRRRAHVDAMVLGRLDENAVAQIVHHQRPDVTQADVEAIVRLSSGIPFYVEELAACEHPALGAPVALLDLVRARLETLSPPARRSGRCRWTSPCPGIDGDGVAEPDLDGGEGDGAAVDEVSFVVAGGDRSGAAELVDGAFDGVAVAVGHRVEGGQSAPGFAASSPGLLVGFERDGRPDPPRPQTRTDRLGRVGLVGQHSIGTATRPAPSRALHAEPVQNQVEGQRVVALPGGGHDAQRPAAGIGEQVDLGAQPAAGAAQSLPITGFAPPRLGIRVIRPSPP